MNLHISLVVAFLAGFWNLNLVLSETPDVLNALNEIRNELNDMKLSNERQIILLEQQVRECRLENAELANQIRTMSEFEKRLKEFETTQQKIVKRLDYLDLHVTTGPVRNDIGMDLQLDTTRADVTEEGRNLHDIMGNRAENDFTGAFDPTSRIYKRIVPVTAYPPCHKHKIAFSVFTATIPVRKKVPMAHAYINEGQGFDMKTSTFRCQIQGVYYISASVVNESHDYMKVDIVKNGDWWESVQVPGGNRDTGFISLVMILVPGDLIWLQHTTESNWYGRYSLSGFILWEW